MIHEYKLRPYHNPEGVDESKAPDGWRFRYADEAGTVAASQCRCYELFSTKLMPGIDYIGDQIDITYIVPVTP